MKKVKRMLKALKFLLSFPLILLLLTACGSTQTPAEKQQEFEELVQLVEARDFEIENQWATSLQGNRISLIGNYNFIRFEGDSIAIDLPYFGVRHSGGGYGTGGGIEFVGQPKKFTVEEDAKGGKLHLSFKGNQDNEDLEFHITLFPNGKATTSVNSSQRSTISFQGEVQ